MSGRGLKEFYEKASDIIEVYFPSLIFLFMFVSYVVLIFCRYILSINVAWLYELNTLSFVWCGIFAASYGSRKESHVRFTILCDHVSPSARKVMKIVEQIFVIVLFVIMFPGAIKNLMFMKVRKSSILKLPYNWVFLPFLFFMVLTIIHSAILLVKEISSYSLKKKED